MAKNLKLNIKNTQLAQALNLGKLKDKLASKATAPKKEEAPEEVAAGLPEEEPRKVKARAKSSAQPQPRPEIEALPEEEAISAGPTAEEAAILLESEEARRAQIEKQKRFLQGEEELEAENAPATPIEEPTIASETSTEAIQVIEEIKETPVKETAYPEKKPEPKKTAPRPEAPKHRRPNLPNSLPELKTRDYKGPKSPFDQTSEAGPRVKLGPTGRHVKDLVKPVEVKPPVKEAPKPAETPKKEFEDGRRKPKDDSASGQAAPAQKHYRESEAPSTEEEPKRGKAKEFLDLKPLKKPTAGRFDSRDRQGLRQSNEDEWRRRRPSKHRYVEEDTTIRPTSLKVRLPISIKDLAVEMKLKSAQLVSKLFLQGLVVTLNDFLDDETTVQLLGQEFGCEIQIDTSEEKRIRITDQTIQEEIKSTDPSLTIIRAPVVAFMGHVDHGKTSLIDAIRKSNRVAGEAGAITQHIGAFRCSTAVGDITILDTPGHEAFSAMRTRGAEVTDIVVLVVAGDEGMKQQTIEALNQARAAGVTIVIAINKADKPGFNAENVYQQLASNDLLPEAWGGAVITVNCSAVTGQGVPELLEMLALQAEILELKANPQARARGTVIESEMHKGMGAVATVLVQNGTLRLGDSCVFDQFFGRIKTMRDEHGKDLTEAGPSTPVLITGLSGLPEAGNEFVVVKSEKEAREIAEVRAEGLRQTSLQQKKKISLENLMQEAAASSKKIANFILRADVQGSLEALKSSLMNIKSSKIDLNIISSGVGEISESDVQLAAASQAIILGFHTQVESHAESLIKQTGVKVNLHNVIYHAIEDVKKLLLDLLDKIPQERDLGMADVLTTFKASQLGVIAGCMVTEGSIVRNQRVRLIRSGEVVWKGHIGSLKRVKEDVKEVKKGFECGILLSNNNDVREGDVIQCYEIYYLTQEL